MATDEKWEIWYKENCKKEFEQKIYKQCDEEDNENDN